MARRYDILVTVKGSRASLPRRLVELVKREVATSLANVGAFDVSTVGDFAGNGNSCDLKRMEELAGAAKYELRVRVEVV